MRREEANIISAIVAQDPIGKLFMARAQHTEMAIRSASMILLDSYNRILKYKPELTQKQYFNLIKLYYTCDAGSYAFFRKFIFDDKMQFKEFHQQLLTRLFESFAETKMPVPSERVSRHYSHDQFTLERDFSSWLGKYHSLFSDNTKVIISKKENLTAGVLAQLEKYNISIVEENSHITQELVESVQYKPVCIITNNLQVILKLYSEGNFKQKTFNLHT